MEKVYKFLYSVSMFFISIATFGQGITVTERENVSTVSFSEASKLTNIGDNRFIDGYVKKYGNGRFIFPVGQNGAYRPFGAEADGTSGAYYRTNPESATLPAGAPFSLGTKASSLTQVSAVEYWDINGSKETKITLTWNATSGIGALTSNTLDKLTIAGWNAATAKWENIAANRDEVSVFGSSTSISSGSITTVVPLIPDQYKAFTLACGTNSTFPSSYVGTLEVAACTEIKGWVWDKNYPNSILTVELIEGNNVLATTAASQFRQDLKDSGIGSGSYGFSMALPVSYMGDGIAHQISVRVRNSTFLLAGSPQTVSCSYGGAFEKVDCYTFSGWAWDKNNPNANQTIELVDGGSVIASLVAKNYRESLKTSGIGTGNYAFNSVIPEVLKDNKQHQLSTRIKGINYVLSGSPQNLTCPLPNYQGSFDYADCNTINGWAWDKNYPNNVLTVEIYEGTTVYATVLANTYSERVKNLGIGSGNYAFSLPMPQAVRDGQPHQLSIRVKGSSYVLMSSPRSVTCSSNQYQGSFDYADCSMLSGWIWDKNFPNNTITVEIVEGSTVYATGLANIYKESLKNSGMGTGNYGFAIALPASLRDGKTHQLGIRAQGSTTLIGSTRTVSCALNQYQGALEYADCTVLKGWLWDKNSPENAITVEIVEGTTVYAAVVANLYKENLKNSGVGTGNYGFSVELPASLRDGKAHQLGVRAKGTTTVLGTLQTLTCAVNNYQGSFDYADCNTLNGWVWDKNLPGNAQTVELYEGTTVYATVLANTYSERVKNLGIGSGNYAFSLPMPQAVRDGQPHQLSIRVKGSSYVLMSSPRSVTCSSNQYQGSFDYADCSMLSGWIWDKNFPNNTITVEIVEGSTVYATGLANIYKESLKNSGMGTGNYGFAIALPASLRDGKTHQLGIRAQGSTTLIGSTRTVSCALNQYQGALEYADCTVLKGWLWDKNSPENAITVEIVEGTTVYAAVVANLYKENLKNSGVGTGNYGFSVELPASLRDGKAHQLGVRAKGTTTVLGTLQTLTCAVNNYQGSFDYADCNTLNGWVWDKNLPGNAQTVELYEGTTVYATVLANTYSERVKNLGIGSGNYAFSLPMPQAVRDGQPHQLSIRVKGSSYVLMSSPRSVTCSSNQYQGSFDYADCSMLSGWIWDKNFPNNTITVEIVEGSTVYATGLANIYKESLKNSGMGTGNYGFAIALPASLRDGKTHQLGIRAQGSTTLIGSTRTVSCALNQYQGALEYADCTVLKGWLWDKNSPENAITVEIVEGTTVYAAVVANLYKENLKNSGVGTGNYGFSVELPASLRDGKAHQLGVRAKGTTTVLGTLQTLTCAVNNYQGSFDYADCKVLTGWVWDKNFPSYALTVEVYEGNTVHATVVANAYSERVKNLGIGSGNYAFSLPMPQAVKDGQVHQLSIKVKDTNYVLMNSQKSLTCASSARISGESMNTIGLQSKPGSSLESIDLKMTVYPNPTNGKVQVRFNSLFNELAQLSVVGKIGQIVFAKKIQGNGQIIIEEIDFSEFTNGTYLILVKMSNGMQWTKRVLVNK